MPHIDFKGHVFESHCLKTHAASRLHYLDYTNNNGDNNIIHRLAMT